MRVRFVEKKGQRRFLDLCVERLSCESIRGLLQFGFDISYSGLKNYYCGRRLLSLDLFLDLCRVAKLDSRSFKIEKVEDSWGKVLGGRKSKRIKIKN